MFRKIEIAVEFVLYFVFLECLIELQWCVLLIILVNKCGRSVDLQSVHIL